MYLYDQVKSIILYDVHTTYWICGFFNEIYDKNL